MNYPYAGKGVFIFGPKFSFPETMSLYISNAIQSLGGVVAGFDGRQLQLGLKEQDCMWGEIQLHTNPKLIDVLFVIKGEGVGKDYALNWKKTHNPSGKTILFWPDPLDEKPEVMQYLRSRRKEYDYLFVCDRGTDAQMEELDACWLPVGYDVFLHTPIEYRPEQEVMDSVFVGTKRAGREFIPKLKPKPWIYGNDWGKKSNDVYLDEKHAILAATKINLNQHFRMGDLPEHSGSGPNHRFFEILASERCMLTDWIPEMGELGFIAGQDFETYSTPKECQQKLTSLLKDPDRRRELAMNGRKAVQGHSFTDRMVQMAKEIDLQ